MGVFWLFASLKTHTCALVSFSQQGHRFLTLCIFIVYSFSLNHSNGLYFAVLYCYVYIDFIIYFTLHKILNTSVHIILHILRI